MLLVGEAGIGKTAVVEEAVSRAAAAGATVLTGRAEPDEGAPAYWPWLRLLEGGAGRASPELLDMRGGAGRVRRRRPVPGGAADRPGARRRRPARARPGGSALGGSGVGRRCSACCAPRSATGRAAGHRDGPAAGHPFPLADFAGLPAVEVLPLGPLEPAAVGAYLTQQVGMTVHGSWSAVVHRLGGGNPLYVRELARLLARGDRLRRPATDVDLPEGLRRLVSRRTDQLSPACRDLLGGAAALGAEIDAPVLRPAAPRAGGGGPAARRGGARGRAGR